MTRQTDPWANWPRAVDRWAFRALVVILTVWTLAIGAGVVGFIVGKIQG